MTETILIEHVKHEGKRSFYYVDEVRCPKAKEMQPALRCKTCEHCRIYLIPKVKCTYADDLKRIEIKSVTGY